MSSLAAQLNLLATGSRGGQKADTRFLSSKQRVSFLFDPSEAGDKDVQTIFNLGLSGLTELRQLDQRFAPFENTLFRGEPGGMKSFDRGSQSRKDTDKLNASVAAFLRVLQPYFLLGAAHKCIEYLVRRYDVQEFYTEALLECALPYHDSKPFARLLQITRVTAPRWQFLQTAQKNNTTVARSTLVSRALKASCSLRLFV